MKIPTRQHTIASTIDESHEEKNNDRRYHLGISLIGDPCDRKLWLSFRWALDTKHTGRMLRLFRRGHNEERTMIDDLKLIGCKISNTQTRLEFGCHVSGSIDGVIDSGLPGAEKSRHLLEMKTHNDKSFQTLKKDGVEKSKPFHYTQMQCYMYGLNAIGLKTARALYLAVNKNDDEYYTERIEYDEEHAQRKIERAKQIAIEPRIPAPLSTNPSWYQCKFCDYYDYCFGGASFVKNCRTCKNCNITPDKFLCGEFEIPNDVQATGCGEYEVICN